MNATGAPSLTLLSLNVNGLGNKTKRLTLFHTLMEGGWDVILLQETHHKDEEQGLRWAREGAGEGRPWPGTSFWVHGTTASRGVAVLLKDTLDLGGKMMDRVDVGLAHISLADLHEPEGRVLRVDFSWGDLFFSAISVYAPAQSEHRKDFFLRQLMPLIPQQRHLLVGGDFNCVKDDLDVTQNAKGSRRVGYTGGLEVVEHAFGLNDVWREQHPSHSQITHVCPSSHTGARLDRWLTSTDVLMHTTSSDIIEGLPGDHLGISMRMVSPQGMHQGPRQWAFPTYLADDEAYCADLHCLVETFVEDNPITSTFDHRRRWDALKAEIRDHCTEYTRRVTLRKATLTRLLKHETAMARKNFVRDPTNGDLFETLQAAQRALDAHVRERAQEAATKAGILWHTYGEQSTFYFYHTMKQRKLKTSWTAVKDKEGKEIPLDTYEDRRHAGDALATFFSSDSPTGLFKPTSCDDQAQDEILRALDKSLTHADREACEGEAAITLEELTDALKQMPRGKKPGSDGLPYEFLLHFWDALGPILLNVFSEAFADTSNPGLSKSQRSGIITMLYKGTGSMADPACYRPLTLMNTDTKLLGRALSDRWLRYADKVVDATQSAFLPQRWIGDNILTHLEAIDFAESRAQPGCIAFLDFAKAYDKLDRSWLGKAMQALGFGPRACRWVTILHQDLRSQVRFNSWLTPSFPVSSGLAQGSPLSPLLFILAAQPLAAHLRLMVREGKLRPMAYPTGDLAPPCYQHADDTTLILSSREEVKKAMEGSLSLFCRASGSTLNATKSKAMLIGSANVFHGKDPHTGIQFLQRGECIRHLGIQLSTDTAAATKKTFDALQGSIFATTKHWAAKQLSYLGRVHVAKQALASKLTFHATFLPLPEEALQRLTSLLTGYIANSAGTMRPGRVTHALPYDRGGLKLTSLTTTTQSLQAKVISRYLEPERLPWKRFFDTHLDLADMQYGGRWIFSTKRIQDLHIANTRAKSYIRSFRSVGVGRCRLADGANMSKEEILTEPLLYNDRITFNGSPFTTTNTGRDLVLAGVKSMNDLLKTPHPPPPWWSNLFNSIPGEWRPALTDSQDGGSEWMWNGVNTVWHKTQTQGDVSWNPYSLTDRWRLVATGHHQEMPYDAKSAAVVTWDQARTWKPGRKHAPDPGWYLLGDIAPTAIFPRIWGVGTGKATELIVRAASERITLTTAVKARVISHEEATVRPPLWGMVDVAPTATGPGLESRWLSLIEGSTSSSTGSSQTACSTKRPASRIDYGLGHAWMSRPHNARLHWKTRIESQEDDGAREPKIAASGVEPQPWAQIWSRLTCPNLSREHRHTAWQVLHATLPCGALRAFRQLSSNNARQDLDLSEIITQAACPYCGTHIETTSHMLFYCPTAQQTWEWVIQVWSLVTGLPKPPMSASIFLLDDRSSWSPSESGANLWSQLRVVVISGLTIAAGQKRKGVPATAYTVAAYTVHHIRKAIKADWQRTWPLHAMAEGICSTSWLRGRSPFLTRAAFTERYKGLVVVDGPSTLRILLTTAHPVAMSSVTNPTALTTQA